MPGSLRWPTTRQSDPTPLEMAPLVLTCFFPPGPPAREAPKAQAAAIDWLTGMSGPTARLSNHDPS
jgi:hypothetical protein